MSVCVGGGGAEVSVLSPPSFFLFWSFFSVDVVSVVCGCVDVAVVSVVLVAAVSLLVVVAFAGAAGGGGGRRCVVRDGGGGGGTCVVVAGTGAGCDGTRTVVEPRGAGCGGAAGALVIGGMLLAIAPGCCGGSTPVAGPPGMFAGAGAVPSVKLPVVSVFVAVATGGCTSPGAPTDVVALLVCPS